MPYVSGSDLKADVLFRGGESSANSNWDPEKIMDYLNRVYRTLCTGASEFLPEYVEDWWWLRRRDVLTLIPPITVGTISVTKNSQAATLSVAPSQSVVGYRLRITGHPEQFEIFAHSGASTPVTLDSPYTGETNAAAQYTLMKVYYTLDSEVQSLVSPMIGFRGNKSILGLSPERMDELFPLSELTTGIPKAFALEDTRTVRFSHGGRTDDQAMRVEYRYRPIVADLTDSDSSIPLVPIEWRHLLSDMALTYLYLDKNDDRSNAVALSARTGLAGMLKVNRRQLSKMGNTIGKIYPRAGGMLGHQVGPLRTDSGLIIG